MDNFREGRKHLFLSHLSGDEVVAHWRCHVLKFLSHLSGDEVNKIVASAGALFLSHLSGDEV